MCSPILCSENEYVFNHVCTPCPDGMENEAGVFFRYCYQRFSHPLLLQSESKELKVQFKLYSSRALRNLARI